jgi:RNA polymerase sigma-70 factor (ECF subfamily)
MPGAGANRTADEAFVGELKAGDDRAYERLVRTHGPAMLAVIRRLLRNDQDAHEALQDAFLGAFRAIGSFEGKAQLSTWLHRIAVNAALMKLRGKRRRPEEPIDPLLPAFQDDGHHMNEPAPWRAPADRPHQSAEREEDRAIVRKAIDRLPESYRNVLILRDIEGLDTDETARLLGVTPNAAKIRLHRARLALRTLLDPHFRQEDLA